MFVLLSILDLFSQRIWEDEQNCEPALQVCGGTWSWRLSRGDQQPAVHLLPGAGEGLGGRVVKETALSPDEGVYVP